MCDFDLPDAKSSSGPIQRRAQQSFHPCMRRAEITKVAYRDIEE